MVVCINAIVCLLCLPQYPVGHFGSLLLTIPHIKEFKKELCGVLWYRFSGTEVGLLRRRDGVCYDSPLTQKTILHWEWMPLNGPEPVSMCLVARILEENICGGIQVATEYTSASWFLTIPVMPKSTSQSSILYFPEQGLFLWT